MIHFSFAIEAVFHTAWVMSYLFLIKMKEVFAARSHRVTYLKPFPCNDRHASINRSFTRGQLVNFVYRGLCRKDILSVSN